MKLTLILLTAILLNTIQLMSQDSSQGLLAKEKEMFSAICNGDKAAAEKLFADDYIINNADGVQQSREETMNTFGKFKGSTYKTEGQQVRLYGNTGVITGKAKFFVKSILVASVIYTEIWVNKTGEWKFAGWQGTMTGGPSWYPIFFTIFLLLLFYFVYRWIRKKLKKKIA